MKPKFILLFCIAVPLFCMAQGQLVRTYSYDAAGNRILRATIDITPRDPSPPSPAPPKDSLQANKGTSGQVDKGTSGEVKSEELRVKSYELKVMSEELQGTTSASQESSMSADLAPNYFVETVAQTEIKIYPNPTTEKITLEISGWKSLQTGRFSLYTLTGQLLQEQPVSSATTTVSLAGFPTGVYMLKVRMNDITEEWKIIKQ